jgi:DNA topoisomerase-1
LPKKKLGIDVEHGFALEYEVLPEKEKVVKELRRLAKDASSIYLATDPDREGEAISWHLIQAAKLDKRLPIRRVVFHEITREAVADAFEHPRQVDMHLVDAQQTRRVLDRLVGYKLSPLLWRKVQRGLSAGRVQSAAVKLVVDRERDIKGFKPVEYWTIQVDLEQSSGARGRFRAALNGYLGGDKIPVPDGETARSLKAALGVSAYSVLSVQTKESPRNPPAPFTTSTLQQEAWRKLRMSAERTMAIAQQLYEGVSIGEEGPVGLITYMRTDSTHVAESAIAETREYIETTYGAAFLPAAHRHFARKSKWTQEAHEAIRPTRTHREPSQVAQYLDGGQLRLYELIWKRMVASQMAAAVYDSVTVEVQAISPTDQKTYVLRATSFRVKFAGFTQVYIEGRDEADAEEVSSPLPHLEKGDALKLIDVIPEQRFTEPLPRYTDATLVKALEQKGIGRPSTYAPIISTIQKRDYVHKEGGKFFAEELGIVVTDLLVKHFPRIVDLGFTASMEEDLDEIAHGKKEWVPVVERFYKPFEEMLGKAADIERVRVIQETGEVCPECGRPMNLRMGRFGKFLACSGYPECKKTAPFLVRTGASCPACGKPLVQKKSMKKRIFYGCSGYPVCKFATRYRPVAAPCPSCGKLLVAYGKDKVRCTACDYKGKEETSDGEGETVAT